jgi:hypothetical protein
VGTVAEQLLLRALNILINLLGVVSGMQTVLGDTAKETSPLILQTIAANAANTVNSPTYGNAALLTAINGLNALIVSATADIEAQILSLTDGTTPVSLPVTPPAGYEAPSSAQNASDVWHYSNSPLFSQAGNYLAAAGNWGAFSANLRWLGDECLYFQAVWHDMDWVGGASDDPPVFDPTDILSTEDVKDCLTRQNPTFTVTWAFEPQGYVRLIGSNGNEVEEWQSTIDGADFALIKAQIFPSSTVNLAPIWPGIAGVTLDSPTALAPSLTISGPMDGVLIDITSVSTSKPALAYGSETAYKFIGALAFVSDNGDVEQFQPLGFQTALYCPLFLKSADSVVLRVDPSVAGTVTPWVIA